MVFKLENGNVAPALYFSGSVLATEQFSIIRDKRHRTVHSDKKKEGGGQMIAGLPVCHLSTKSSPSRPTTMLSELIMSRIKSREEEKKGAQTQYLLLTENSDQLFRYSSFLIDYEINKMQKRRDKLSLTLAKAKQNGCLCA